MARESRFVMPASNATPAPTPMVKKKENPAVKKDNPAVKKDNPAVKKDNPVVKKDNPAVKKDNPVVKKQIKQVKSTEKPADGGGAVSAKQLKASQSSKLKQVQVAMMYQDDAEEKEIFQPIAYDKVQLLELYSNNDDSVTQTADGKSLLFVQKDDNGVKRKLVNFNEEVNLAHFKYHEEDPNALLPIIGNALYRLQPVGKGNVMTDQKELLLSFQKAANNNNLNALIFESKQYGPIAIDGKLGRQTVRAIIFAYELGELMVAFGLVNSFEQYRTMFNEGRDGKPSARFQERLLIFKQFVNNNKKVKDLVLQGQPLTDPNVGSISGNTGDAIIGLYNLYRQGKIGKPDLLNIAKQDKIMIKSSVSSADTVPPFTRLPAVREAKMAMFSINKDGGRLFKRGQFDGSWDAEFEGSLFNATGSRVIDQATAQKLINMIDKRMTEIETLLTSPDSILRKFPKFITEEQIAKWLVDYKKFKDLADDAGGTKEPAMSKAEALYNINEIVVENYLKALKAALFAKLSVRLDDLKESIYGDSQGKGAIPSLKSGDIDDYVRLSKLLDSLLKIPVLADANTKLLDDSIAQSNLLSVLTDTDLATPQLTRNSKARDKINEAVAEFVVAAPNANQFEGMQEIFGALKNDFDTYIKDYIAAIKLKLTAIEEEKRSAAETYAMMLGFGDWALVTDDIPIMQHNRKKAYYLDRVKVRTVVTASILNTDDILATPQHKYFIILAKILKNKEAYKGLLADAEKIYVAKLNNIVANEDAFLEPYDDKFVNYMTFEECLTAESKGRRISLGSAAIFQAYMEQEKLEYVEGQVKDGLIRGVTKDVLQKFVDKYITVNP